MTLARNVDSDPARRALASALLFRAREAGCQFLAGGIETLSELEALKLLGIRKGRGYFLGRPVPLQAALEMTSANQAGAPSNAS